MHSAVLAMIDSVCLTVRSSDWLSVTRWYHAKTTPATIMRSSLEDSPMTLRVQVKRVRVKRVPVKRVR